MHASVSPVTSGEITGRVEGQQGKPAHGKVRETRRARKPPRGRVTAASLENAAVYYLSRFALLERQSAPRADAQSRPRRARRRGGPGRSRRANGRGADRALSRQRPAQRPRLCGAGRGIARAARRLALLDRRQARGQKGVDSELVDANHRRARRGRRARPNSPPLARWCAGGGLGPYRTPDKRADFRDKDLASLARAGFGLDLARRVLRAKDVEALERLARGDGRRGLGCRRRCSRPRRWSG